MSASITAQVRAALAGGFRGTPKELAANLDIDVRRVYHARYLLRTCRGAGSRRAQPSKRRRGFVS